MKMIDLLRLLRRHLVLLLLIPVVLAGLVVYMTRNPTYKFASETILYTGIASGTSIDLNKSFSFFANNTAFDNLINIIKSRETQKEVSIRLLVQHLMLEKADPQYISGKSLADLKRITPDYIEKMVVRPTKRKGHTRANATTDPGNGSNDSIWILQPPGIDRVAYEATVKKLMDYTERDDTNFVYGLLNFGNPHYSVSAISSMTVVRIASSDLVKIHYESDDPGICQQTLAILTGVCIMNYKNVKENRSDAVVKYFQNQVAGAAERLKVAEDRLLNFNQDNNIINYYEQSKAVAIVKEELDVDYHNKRIKLAGIEAAIKRLEEKLKTQQQIQLNNATIIDKRNRLSEITFTIANAEIAGGKDSLSGQALVQLKIQADKLKDDIRASVNDLSRYGTSPEGVPVSQLLADWISSIIDFEETRAGLAVLGDRIKDFQKQYAAYAPAGANLKRIEREINVSEQEYLELLHGLNLAKLKMQDAEISSNIKAVDPPYYPLSPIPTKRKILIIIAALLGFLLTLTTILVMEYFDDTLRSPEKASRITGLEIVGIFPKIFLKTGSLNFPFVANRMLELIIQKIEHHPDVKEGGHPRTIMFVSTLSNEGKSVMTGNLARKMVSQGKRVQVLTFSRESLRKMEVAQAGYPEKPPPVSKSGLIRPRRTFTFLNRLLGYPDTRVDRDSPFLQAPIEYLKPENHAIYTVDTAYFSLHSWKELTLQNPTRQEPPPDFIFIEVPSLLYYSYPPELISGSTLSILVARSNRVWRTADRNALATYEKISDRKPLLLLNGVELNVIETFFGELIRKRSWMRRMFKKAVRFEFFTRQQP